MLKKKNRILTDAFREVKHTKSRFFSLFLLSALSVAFLAGLRTTAPDMQHSADLYFDDTRMMDIHVLSTLGLTQDDVDALAQRPELSQVEGAYTVDAMLSLSTGDSVVKTISYREGGLNQPTLVEGRMPQAPNECLLDSALLDDSMHIGDTLTFDPGDGDMKDAFAYASYTIVGTARTPLYIAIDRGTSTLGSGRVAAYILIPEEGYSLDIYTDIYATVTGAKDLNCYTDAYDDLLEQTTDALSPLGDQRADARYDEVVGDAQDQLAEAQQKLDDAQQEADDELADAAEQLSDARKKLDSGWKDYRSGLTELADRKAEGQRQIEENEQKLADAAEQLSDAENQLSDALYSLQEGETQYESGRLEYEKGVADYESGLAEYESGKKEYDQGAAALASASSQLSAAKQQLDTQQASFDTLVTTLRGYLAPRPAPPSGGDNGETGGETGGGEETPDPGEGEGEAEGVQTQSALSLLTDDDNAASDPLASNSAFLAALRAEQALPADQRTLTPSVDLILSQMAAAQPEAQIPASSAALLAASDALADGWSQYQSGLQSYQSGAAQLSAAAQKLAEAKKQLDDAKQQLDEAEATLSDSRKTLDDGWADYHSGKADYESGLAEYQDGVRQLSDAKQQLREGIADGEKQLASALRTLQKGERDYETGLSDYETGKTEAETKLSDARNELNDAARKIQDIEDCQWYILDRNTNIGFVTFGQDSDRMSGLASVFPLIFFLVAALVCLTTMTRMVEEQRVQIGGLKALGFSKGAIAFKYVGYGFSTGLLGGIFGLIAGCISIPWIIYNAWCIMYALPPITFLPQPFICTVSLLAAVLVLTLSALAACLEALRSVPAQLMRPKAPPAGKRVLLEHIPFLWKRFSFNQKVTLRNLFRYKKRFIMTLAGICGCTALIATGFGIRDSIYAIMDKQYDELTHYTATLSVADNVTDSERQQLTLALDGCDDVADYLMCTQTSVTAETGAYSLSANVVSAATPQELERFFTYRERLSGEAVPFEEDSVLLSEKTATMLDVSPGDTVTLVSGDDRYEVTVTGIIEHYVQHYFYMTDSTYEQVFGHAPDDNSYLLRYVDNTQDTADRVALRLVSLSGVTSLTRLQTMRDTMQHSMEAVDYAVVLIIISAAALAFVVLYNLTNINITERMRELATLKVLGFYDRELSAYVYRENILLTILGALLGLVAGKFLHIYLIHTVEIDMVMFGRNINPSSYVISAVLTVIFSLSVNLVAHKKLKKLSMVESLKTVE